jgi:ABC-type multidrug transport system ATPase subunit
VKIEVQNIGKKFGGKYIFRNLHRTFTTGEHVGIVGQNGSGKSTLVQIISGYLSASEGLVQYEGIASDNLWKHISLCSPAMGLYEDYTLEEHLQFTHGLKPFAQAINLRDIPEILQLEKHAHKPLKYFSSGMKQRVKLGTALLSDVSCVFLDEPCAHLDREAENWFSNFVLSNKNQKTIIVASNASEAELTGCSDVWTLS